MAEVIGVASAAVGLAATAAHSARRILEIIDTVRNGSEKLKDLKKELETLQPVLDAVHDAALQAISERDPTFPALKECQKELEELESEIRTLAKEDGDSSSQRFKKGVGIFFKEGQLEKKVQALQRHENRVSFAMITSIYANMQSSQSTSRDRLPNESIRKLKRVATLKTSTEITVTSEVDIDPGAYAELSEGHNLRHGYADLHDLHSTDILMGGSAPNKATKKALANSGLTQAQVHLLQVMKKVIDQSVQKAFSRLQENPDSDAKIEDFVPGLDAGQAKEFWKLDLDSIKQLRALTMVARREKFLRSLPVPADWSDQSQVKNATDNTCTWIFDNPVFRQWWNGNRSCLLHIDGKPGSGKSVLAKHILTHKKECRTVLYYFCNNRQRANENASSALSALIKQLVDTHIELLDEALDSARSTDQHAFLREDVSRWSFDRLWEIFEILFRKTKLRKIWIFIDALDECEHESAKRLLKRLLSLFENPGEIRLMLLVTSRNDMDISPLLSRISADKKLSLHLHAKLLHGDIVQFIQKKVKKLADEAMLTEEEEAEVQNELANRADGMFLWASLAIKETRNLGFDLSLPAILETIRDFPQELGAIYDKALAKIDQTCRRESDWLFVRKVFIWVTLSERPLSLRELQAAISINNTHSSATSLRSNYLRAIVKMMKPLGSFIDIVPGQGTDKRESNERTEGNQPDDLDATVRLIHQTAKDYLLGRLRLEKFKFDQISGNRTIALACLRYLMFEEFGSGGVTSESITTPRPASNCEPEAPQPIKEIVDKRLKGHELLNYAALHWCQHLRRLDSSQSNSEALQLACDLLIKFPKNLDSWYQVVVCLSNGNRKYAPGFSGLHVAGSWGLYDLACMLLESGQDINSIWNDNTPLMSAIWRSDPAPAAERIRLIHLFLQKGANVNASRNDGFTALLIASYKGLVDIAELLLGAGADVNVCRVSNGWTPLHHACDKNYIDIVDMLLKRHAQLDCRSLVGETPMHKAAASGFTEPIELLLEHRASIDPTNQDGEQPIHTAAQAGKKEVVRLLLKRGARPDIVTNDGSQPMHLAATNGHLEVMKLLVEWKAPIDAVDEDGWQPIHLAAYNGRVEAMKVLLEHGALIDAKDNDGDQPIHVAVINGELEVVKVLLEHGALIDAKDNDRDQPIHVAARHCKLEAAKLLLERGALVDEMNFWGDQPIHTAAIARESELVKLLLEHRESTSSIDSSGSAVEAAMSQKEYTEPAQISKRVVGRVLCIAIRMQDMKTFKIVLKHGVDESDLPGALSVAVWNDWEEGVKILLQHGVPVTVHALRLSAVMARLDILRLFLQHGVDLDAVDEDGESALHWAITIPDNGEILDLLVAAGADRHRPTGYGWLPNGIASYYGNTSFQMQADDVRNTPLHKPLPCPPSCFEKTGGSDSVSVSQDGLLVTQSLPGLPWSVRGNRPICIGASSFYWEVEVTHVNSSKSAVGVGYCALDANLRYSFPGWFDTSNPSCAYHGDDGDIFSSITHKDGTSVPTETLFGTGDIAGAGLDLVKGVVYFTKNGKRLKHEVPDMRGKLYPVLGMHYGGQIRANFGTDPERPFKYKPELDSNSVAADV